MSTAYEQSGRSGQKQRTRGDLIAAARVLVAQGGVPPTVEDVAAAASISRTTAYRYFPNQKALLVAAHPETAATTLLPPPGIGDDPEVRLRAAVEAFIRLIIDTEPQQRTMLRLSLDPGSAPDDLPLRQGRAIAWFADALAPLCPRLPEAVVHRLAVAVRNTTGIESLVWLTDVAGLSRDEAVELMQWSATALLRQTLADHPRRVTTRAGRLPLR